MNLKQLVEVVAAQENLSKATAHKHVNTVFDVIAAQVADGGEVVIAGFGRFTKKASPARTVKVPSFNPDMSGHTSAEVQVPASWRVTFTPFKELKGREV